MSVSGGGRSRGPYRVLSGLCPDKKCQAKLFFPAYDSSIECTNCGQRHEQKALVNVEQVTNPDIALHNILRNILLGNTKPKKGTDSVKVLGLSNYECKLLSPLLSKYGMDKQTGKAKLLEHMGPSATFDCSILGDRAFLLEPENIDVVGYGRDRTGSMNYLRQTLECIKKCNDNEERLLPIHADGDGHCLVHAVSRALIGRELFWHALRENLKVHFTTHLETYKHLFKDFIDVDEWRDIIAECDPDFVPLDGEPLGLRNIHIFGLANVLHRPIILLDSVSGIQSSGDYTGVFLPGLLEPSQCHGRDGQLNKPLCLAWSSMGRNHYIALVGVKGGPAPKLPGWMMPKAWGMDQSLMNRYIDFDENSSCTIGGDKCLQPSYVQRLVKAMEEVFMETYHVSAALVADVHQYVFKCTGVVGVRQEVVLDETVRAVEENRLFRCLTCFAISQLTITSEWLKPGGSLYTLAEKTHGPLNPKKNYSFPMQGLVCSYDADKDELVPNPKRSKLTTCQFCQGQQMRSLLGDGTIQYANGDTTLTRSERSRCQCGFKHYWDHREYDNLPEIFPITLEWAGKMVKEKVVWFQYESDATLNSNVFEVAQALVQKHFPGEFGSERLVQKVVDTILRQTASKENAEPAKSAMEDGATSGCEKTDDAWREDVVSKIILTGHAHKTLHKEELGKSDAEKLVKARIEHKAAAMQKRKTTEQTKQGKPVKSSPSQTSPKLQKTAETEPKDSPGGSSSTPKSPVTRQSSDGVMKIRVSTSDGRQVMLSLEANTTFSALQDQLTNILDIARERQKIKHGFPPRELVAPAEGSEAEHLPLRHGDRIMVEILPVQGAGEPQAGNESAETSVVPPVDTWPAAKPQRQSWSGFDPSTHDQSAQDLLKGLADLQHTSADSIDTSIASLALMATLTGKDLWSYVQGMPHLFSVGGLFYEQMKRDLGLSDGMHCTLPSLPGKVLRYCSKNDRLELCLEPRGHFAIEPGIEEKVLQSALYLQSPKPSSSGETARALSAGSSGVVVNKSMRIPTSQVPFSGQGHSLTGSRSENIHMPGDIEPTTHRNKGVRRLGSLEHEVSQESIEEVDESVTDMDTDQSPIPGLAASRSDTEPAFKRVGPGYTVLNQQCTNEANVASELFRTIASSLQTLVEEDSQDPGEESDMQVTDNIQAMTDEDTSELQEGMKLETQGAVSDRVDSQHVDSSQPEVCQPSPGTQGAVSDCVDSQHVDSSQPEVCHPSPGTQGAVSDCVDSQHVDSSLPEVHHTSPGIQSSQSVDAEVSFTDTNSTITSNPLGETAMSETESSNPPEMLGDQPDQTQTDHTQQGSIDSGNSSAAIFCVAEVPDGTVVTCSDGSDVMSDDQHVSGTVVESPVSLTNVKEETMDAT